VAEPRDAVKGMVARVQFYMHDRYDLTMSTQQQRLLMAWNKQFAFRTRSSSAIDGSPTSWAIQIPS
jgi:endonuclease I